MSAFHRLFLVASLLGGMVVTYLAYSFSEELSIRFAEERFQDVAIVRVADVVEKVQDVKDALHSLKAFYDSSDNVTEQDFSSFTSVIAKNLPPLSLAFVEQIAKSKFFSSPSYQHNNKHFSFDYQLADYQELVSALATLQTDEQGLTSITLQIYEENESTNIMIVALPVFSQNNPFKGDNDLRGFLLLAINLNELIVNSINELPIEPVVLTAKLDETMLAVFDDALVGAVSKGLNEFSPDEFNMQFSELAGPIKITAFSKNSLFYKRSYLSKVTLGLGVVITLLLTYIFHISIKRHLHVVKLVEQKTFDLEHANQVISKQEKQLAVKVGTQLKLKEIRKALSRGEMVLYYQPKVNMRTGDILGAEALIRWLNPEKGMIPPMEFLPVIDGTELECQVGNWVIEQALAQLNSWQQQGLKLQVSVNISSHHLQDANFFKQLAKALSRYPNIEPSSLQLEILESTALGDTKTISSIIAKCKQSLNISVALDDFGTGYSSLNHLRNLPVDVIKVDTSFVRDMLDDPSDYAIVDGVIGLADSFHREVIAEGVETTLHGLMLLLNNCEQAQGYGIAKPMPANEFINWTQHYTPNQEWIRCGEERRTTKQSRIKLAQLIIRQWIDKFKNNIHSSSRDLNKGPIMDYNGCHFSDWYKRAMQSLLFDAGWLKEVDQLHQAVHNLANVLWQKYQGTDTQVLAEDYAELEVVFEKLLGMFEAEYLNVRTQER